MSEAAAHTEKAADYELTAAAAVSSAEAELAIDEASRLVETTTTLT
jgi:hypothetical protein